MQINILIFKNKSPALIQQNLKIQLGTYRSKEYFGVNHGPEELWQEWCLFLFFISNVINTFLNTDFLY